MKAERLRQLLDVLDLIAEGLTYPAIGKKLGLSKEGVKSRAHELFDHLGARDRAHAVSLGYQRGYLTVEDPQ